MFTKLYETIDRYLQPHRRNKADIHRALVKSTHRRSLNPADAAQPSPLRLAPLLSRHDSDDTVVAWIPADHYVSCRPSSHHRRRHIACLSTTRPSCLALPDANPVTTVRRCAAQSASLKVESFAKNLASHRERWFVRRSSFGTQECSWMRMGITGIRT